jgi:hypothetical protein
MRNNYFFSTTCITELEGKAQKEEEDEDENESDSSDVGCAGG